MLPFFPTFIPNLLQVAPFVLAFAVFGAAALRKHAGIFYMLFTLAVVAVSWHDLVMLIMQGATPSFVYHYEAVLDALVSNSPLVSTVVTLLTSSFTGVFLYLIVMFVGALELSPLVKKLLSIRSELSIIGGIIIMGHVVRIIEFPFMFMNPQWQALWGEPAGTFMFIAAVLIGPALTIVFLVPWITSFKGVRKRMSFATWKKTQLLAYPFMALMIGQGFFLALGHCLFGYPFEGSSFAMSIMSNPSEWLQTFAQQVATAWMYLTLGVAYVVLRLQRYRRKKAKQESTATKVIEQVP